jgi:hypothetical protein
MVPGTIYSLQLVLVIILFFEAVAYGYLQFAACACDSDFFCSRVAWSFGFLLFYAFSSSSCSRRYMKNKEKRRK